MATTIEQKRQHEKKIFSEMLRLYCRKKHGHPGALCESCYELERYAHKRVDHCRYMETKTFCAHCPHPCYSSEMRRKIKDVMRYTGPKMLLYHPMMVFRHIFISVVAKFLPHRP